MATWAEFSAADPKMAERGAERLRVGVAYLAAAGEDGEAHVHPVTPLIADGGLAAFVDLGTPKERNLRRDGRYAMHAALGDDDEEFILRGRAVVTDDPGSEALAWKAARAIGMTSKNHVLMEFTIERAHWAVWQGLGTPDIRRTARSWRGS